MNIMNFGRHTGFVRTKGLKERIREAEKEIQMSREAKFRVWDKKEKRMYGQQDKYTCGLVILLDGLTEYGGCLDYSSEPEFDSFQWYNKEIVEKRYVLMQFTGLKERYGEHRDIWQGDIIKWYPVKYDWDDYCSDDLNEEEIGIIVWFQPAGRWAIEVRGRTYWPKEIDFFDVEIIGNIHQNPELMEQE